MTPSREEALMECPSELMEKLASLEHERWSDWMSYMFSKGIFNTDGTWTMPKWAVDRWVPQANLPYSVLPEEQKESDRKEVRRYWELLTALRATPTPAGMLEQMAEALKLCCGDAVVCKDCGWIGHYDSLLEATGNDCCPKCGSTDLGDPEIHEIAEPVLSAYRAHQASRQQGEGERHV